MNQCRCSKCAAAAAARMNPCRETVASEPVMAFVPVQQSTAMYNECQALMRGTLFIVLDKPFKGKGGCCSE